MTPDTTITPAIAILAGTELRRTIAAEPTAYSAATVRRVGPPGRAVVPHRCQVAAVPPGADAGAAQYPRPVGDGGQCA